MTQRTGKLIRSILSFAMPLCICWMLIDSCFAADEFLERALLKIELPLNNPRPDYGLFVTDTYSRQFSDSLRDAEPSSSGKQGFGFYVSGDKLKYVHDKYRLIDGSFVAVSRHIYLSHAADRTGVAVDVDQDDIVTVSQNAPRPTTRGIGTKDSYTWEYGREHPKLQPFQILANPCFAQLTRSPAKLSLKELRESAVELPSTEAKKKLYQVQKKLGIEEIVVRLQFSLDHDDQLDKSEVELYHVGKDGKKVLAMRVVRSIENWQKLSDDRLVPARFTLTSERVGVEKIQLVRDITDVSIDQPPTASFEASSIAELQRQPDAEYVLGSNASGIELPIGRSRSWLIWLNVVAIFVLVLFFARKRLSLSVAKHST